MKIEMTTLVKKAREYVEGVMSNSRSPMGMYLENDMIGIGIQCYEVGYNEAMRWRDPKEELPEGGILVQIKFDCSKYKGHPYSHDVFLSGLNRWNIEHHADIKVTGWRPIE